MPKSIDEIPEISFDEIKAQIQRETYFSNLCKDVLNTFAQRERDNQITDADYYEIAGIMGLCPGHCDWHETLFPHLVDLFVSSEEEGKQILDSVQKQPGLVQLMVTVMSDGLRQGQIIRHGNRYLCSQGYARNYFRGENAYNKCCKPSAFRTLPQDPQQQKIERVLSIMRTIEFSLWLQSLSFVRGWPYGDVFHGAIAQHYGIPTNGIDITSDLKTALFFACCHCDEDGKWRALGPDEYAKADSREAVEKRGGDSRYGILFTAPADTANMSAAAQIPELHLASVTPIGFQPFMRCSSQSGYMIEAGNPYDLFQDPSFNKVKFRLTPDICDWIFREMDGGKKVYPNEMFGSCEDVIKALKIRNEFSEQAFSLAAERMGLHADKEQLRDELGTRGYRIVPSVQLCSKRRQAEIENNYFAAYQKNKNQMPPSQLRIQFAF